MYLYLHLFLFLYPYIYLYLSIYLTIYLSIYLSMYIYIYAYSVWYIHHDNPGSLLHPDGARDNIISSAKLDASVPQRPMASVAMVWHGEFPYFFKGKSRRKPWKIMVSWMIAGGSPPKKIRTPPLNWVQLSFDTVGVRLGEFQQSSTPGFRCPCF